MFFKSCNAYFEYWYRTIISRKMHQLVGYVSMMTRLLFFGYFFIWATGKYVKLVVNIWSCSSIFLSWLHLFKAKCKYFRQPVNQYLHLLCVLENMSSYCLCFKPTGPFIKQVAIVWTHFQPLTTIKKVQGT